MASVPGAVHEGNGTLQVIVDEQASQAQRDAIKSICYGEYGGLPWEVFAVVFPHKRELVTAPIAFTYDREGRSASVDIPGWVRLEVEPIKNPVTGEEHRARIVLPEGMEFKEAEMGNTVSMSVTAEAPLNFADENSYAQLAHVEWTNVI